MTVRTGGCPEPQDSFASRRNATTDGVQVHLGRNGTELVALTDRHGSTIVEFWPGTGQFIIEAARRFGSVVAVAVDASPVMLHRLRHSLAVAKIGNVEVVGGGDRTRPSGAEVSRVRHTPSAGRPGRFRSSLGSTRIQTPIRAEQRDGARIAR